jgi:hypothetical protein
MKKPVKKMKGKKKALQREKVQKIHVKCKKIQKQKSKAVSKVLPSEGAFKCPYCPR